MLAVAVDFVVVGVVVVVLLVSVVGLVVEIEILLGVSFFSNARVVEVDSEEVPTGLERLRSAMVFYLFSVQSGNDAALQIQQQKSLRQDSVRSSPPLS